MRRFLSIFFLLIFTYQSIGQSINYHYCHGELTGVSLVESVKCCCAPNVNISECSPKSIGNDLKINKTDCCSTSSSTEITEVVNEKITTNPIHLIQTLAEVFTSDLVELSSVHTKAIKHYYEPNLIFDIPVKLQSFII